MKDPAFGAPFQISRPLLILDLDETLIFSTEQLRARRPDFHVSSYAVYVRPHLREFLTRIQPDYDLAVWTASTLDYAEHIVAALLPPGVVLQFLWSRNRCRWCRDADCDRPYWRKDLRKLRRQGYDLNRVLFVDDNPKGLEKSYGNHVLISPYDGNESDAELRWLGEYLLSISGTSNFRALEKRFWRSSFVKS